MTSNRKPFADLTRAFTEERRRAVEIRKQQLLGEQAAQPSS